MSWVGEEAQPSTDTCFGSWDKFLEMPAGSSCPVVSSACVLDMGHCGIGVVANENGGAKGNHQQCVIAEAGVGRNALEIACGVERCEDLVGARHASWGRLVHVGATDPQVGG